VVSRKATRPASALAGREPRGSVVSNNTSEETGRRRLEWLSTINGVPEYSLLALRIAGLLAWDYSDKITGETFVGVEEIVGRTGFEKRAIQKWLSQFQTDGYLTKIKSHAPDCPSRMPRH
jgi:hypothetical protein